MASRFFLPSSPLKRSEMALFQALQAYLFAGSTKCTKHGGVDDRPSQDLHGDLGGVDGDYLGLCIELEHISGPIGVYYYLAVLFKSAGHIDYIKQGDILHNDVIRFIYLAF